MDEVNLREIESIVKKAGGKGFKIDPNTGEIIVIPYEMIDQNNDSDCQMGAELRGFNNTNEGNTAHYENFLKHYDDFLYDILAERGLNHGYNLLNEGFMLDHRIFVGNAIKNSFLERLIQPTLWGQIYSVNTVARFTVEPTINIEACRGGRIPVGSTQIELIDPKYAEQISQITQRINEYCRKREDNTLPVLARQREPLVLVWR